MAVSPTYPGVYISETASVPHSVTPATTNLTAFIGEFPQGTLDRAVYVSSQAQFEAEFGALSTASSLAALGVWHFFLNGGIGAWIVRIAPGADTAAQPAVGQPVDTAQAASVTVDVVGYPNALTISANSPGEWGDGLEVYFQASGPAGHPSTSHVDMYVCPVRPVTSPPSPKQPPKEMLPNIPIQDSAGNPLPALRVAAIINGQSSYVSVAPAETLSPPAPSAPASAAVPAPLVGGSDGTWSTAGFLNAIEAEVQPGARLDQLAPNTFNLMCIPDLATYDVGDQTGVFGDAHKFCLDREAFLLLDPPPPAAAVEANPDWTAQGVDNIGLANSTGMTNLLAWAQDFIAPDNYAAATYYPWLEIVDPVTLQPAYLPPSAAVAGVYATTDGARGVWKAPAGTDAGLHGISGLADTSINDDVNGQLNVLGINCLRTFPVYGTIVWGSRTLAGSDLAGSPFKYVPVRRLTNFIELSLQQSLRWAVFEPNGPMLWSSISLEVTAFMAGLFGAGAFAGTTATSAYSVVCDATTTSPMDMINGIVNVNVGFAPVDPAEFVMLNVQINAASAAS